MKIKNMAAVLLLILTCGYSSVVSAAEIQTVQLTEENQLVYTKDKTELAGAFDGMAPGDSRTVVIKIENQNSHKASFFISQKTKSFHFHQTPGTRQAPLRSHLLRYSPELP